VQAGGFVSEKLTAKRLCCWFILILALCANGLVCAEPARSWSALNLEKRCEGMLEFLQARTAVDLREWSMIKPQCVVAGGAEGDVSWSLEALWKKGNKALPLRYIVTESKTQKPKTNWCVVKGKKFGCAAPWEAEFSQGKLFPNKKDSTAAYQEVLKFSQGFLGLATKLDEWVGQNGDVSKIFDLPYSDWVKAWSNAPRSLPVNKEVFVAEYQIERNLPTAGVVRIKGDAPKELRECLGCVKTSCEKSPILFSFSGLGLTFTRDLTAEERESSPLKTARVAWIMMEPTPFVAGEPKWPFLCGEHRFNIVKISSEKKKEPTPSAK
jgi:hypothetical protein